MIKKKNKKKKKRNCPEQFCSGILIIKQGIPIAKNSHCRPKASSSEKERHSNDVREFETKC